MAVFSTNQTRQLYVVNETPKTPTVLNTDAAGSISVHATADGSGVYFKYKGADNVMRSDLIDIKNIISAKATDADSMAHTPKSVLVTLDTEVNDGDIVAGQDYILRVVFKQFVGISDADQYFKYGMVHGYSGMTASKFYAKLAESLANNFSREATKLVSIYLVSGESKDVEEGEVIPGGYIVDSDGAKTKLADSSVTYTGVLIEEVEQPWVLGKIAQTPVYFDVFPSTVLVEGDERIWGKAKVTEISSEDLKAKQIGNGKTIADLEYFCMGERGDVYRGAGYPNNINTQYLVNPSNKYNTIDIHYAYVGDNESVQKSEKTITFVVPKIGDTNSVSNVKTNALISLINQKAKTQISMLSISDQY